MILRKVAIKVDCLDEMESHFHFIFIRDLSVYFCSNFIVSIHVYWTFRIVLLKINLKSFYWLKEKIWFIVSLTRSCITIWLYAQCHRCLAVISGLSFNCVGTGAAPTISRSSLSGGGSGGLLGGVSIWTLSSKDACFVMLPVSRQLKILTYTIRIS